MPFRTSALDNSNLPINDFSTFIYWKKMYFPKDFLEHYFQELFELNVLTQEEKDLIKNHSMVRGFRKDTLSFAKLEKAVPVLLEGKNFKIFRKSNIDNTNLNKKIQASLARQEHRLLLLKGFVEAVTSSSIEWKVHKEVLDSQDVDKIIVSEGEEIKDDSQLLSCYAQIFIRHGKRDFVPLIVKKGFETGQLALVNWCLNRLKTMGFTVQGLNEKKYALFQVAAEGLHYHLKDPELFIEKKIDFLEKWNSLAQEFILCGIKGQVKPDLLRLILREILFFQRSHQYSEVLPSLFSTLLLLEPYLTMKCLKEKYWDGILGFLFKKGFSLYEERSVDHNEDNFRLKLFFPDKSYYKQKVSARERKERLHECEISSTFFEKVMEYFIGRYARLRFEKKPSPLAKDKMIFYFLEFLAAQGNKDVKRFEEAKALINQGIALYCEKLTCHKLSKAVEDGWNEWEKRRLALNFPECMKMMIGWIMESIQAGIGVEYVDRQGMTLLHQAVHYRFRALVKFLLEVGFNTSIQSLMGHTALHVALSKACGELDEELVLLLVKHSQGRELVQQDKHGWTPLHHLVKLKKENFLNNFLHLALRKGMEFKLLETIWRREAPLVERRWGLFLRWTRYLKERHHWGKHRKTAVEIAEHKGLNRIRDKLLSYEKKCHVEAWSLPIDEKKQELEELLQIDVQEKDEGTVFYIERRFENEEVKSDSEESEIKLYESMESIRILESPINEENKIIKILEDERRSLKASLDSMLKNQKKEGKIVETRLARLEDILKEELKIQEFYKIVVGNNELSDRYYQEVRVQVSAYFNTILLLATKLVTARDKQLQDVTLSHSCVDDYLNITVTNREQSTLGIKKTFLFLARHSEFIVKSITGNLSIVCEGLCKVLGILPFIGPGAKAAEALVNTVGMGVDKLTEYLRELNRIKRSKGALGRLTNREVERLAEKLALIMTKRVQEVLSFLTVEGIDELAFLDARRLLFGLLNGNFVATKSLENIINELCDKPLQQSRILSCISLSGKVSLNKSALLQWINSHCEEKVNERDLLDSVDDNELHHGVKAIINKLMESVPKRKNKDIEEKKFEKKDVLKNSKSEEQNLEDLSLPELLKEDKREDVAEVKKISSEQPSSKAVSGVVSGEILGNVKKNYKFLNRIIDLEKQSENLRKKNNDLVKRINDLQKKLSEEETKKKLQKNQYYYTRGLENYKLGKAYYKARTVEEKTETYKIMCDMRGLYFFTKAKDTFQKIEGNFLKEKGIELDKYLKNCDFYCKLSSIDGTKCGEGEEHLVKKIL